MPAVKAGAPTKKRKHLEIRELFEFLIANKSPLGCFQEPSGNKNLLDFLAERFGTTRQTMDKKLNELAELGYITLENYQKRPDRLFRVKILINQWDPAKIPSVAAPVKPAAIAARPSKRGFLLFVDYENIRRNLKLTDERARKFDWIRDYVLKKGKIFLAVIFAPDSANVPIMQLSQQGFYVVVCPRRMGQVVTKDADTVDAKMIGLAQSLIFVSSDLITDVVIVAGDGDYEPLVAFAKLQQKNVIMVSTSQALSGRFLEMQESGMLKVKIVGTETV